MFADFNKYSEEDDPFCSFIQIMILILSFARDFQRLFLGGIPCPPCVPQTTRRLISYSKGTIWSLYSGGLSQLKCPTNCLILSIDYSSVCETQFLSLLSVKSFIHGRLLCSLNCLLYFRDHHDNIISIHANALAWDPFSLARKRGNRGTEWNTTFVHDRETQVFVGILS